jgi:glutaredoxin-like protein
MMNSQQNEKRFTVYGTVWCGDCRRTRAYLDRNQIAYQFIDIDRDSNAEAYVKQVNRGYRSVPTIVASDGSRLVEPTEMQLAQWVAEHTPQPV